MSNDPTYFPEPKRFVPERWLKQNTGKRVKGDNWVKREEYKRWALCRIFSCQLPTCWPEDTSICQSSLWLWTSHVRRSKICRNRIAHVVGQGNEECGFICSFCHRHFNCMSFQIFRKYKVSYNSGEFVYRVNSTYIPQSPLNFKLTLREE